MSDPSDVIVLGLGSSDVRAMDKLRQALAALKREPGFSRTRVSPVYASDAMLPPGAPAGWAVPYLNLAVACRWDVDPETALAAIQRIERALGRRERERWAPREIDIDLLAWGRLERTGERLVLPHPGLRERPFALLPLADVAPEWRPPGSEATAAELARPWRDAAPERVPFRTRRSPDPLVEIVGILNLTPDSFSDGGALGSAARLLERARGLVADGASVLELGAESTRPGAVPVDPETEWRRLEPALVALREARVPGRLAVDTRHGATARRAAALGVDWLNDVAGFADDAMVEAAAGARGAVVFMHSLGVPPEADRTLARDRDAVAQVLEWGEARARELVARGIARERLVFDPGIGFGKTLAQNWALLRGAGRLHALGLPLLIGHSRKSFLAAVTDRPAAERDPETAFVGAELARLGVEYLRVHEPAALARAIRVARAWDAG